MSWDRNNLAPHALPSFLCDYLSPSSAGLNLGCHLGQSGTLPMVASNGPNTSLYIWKITNSISFKLINLEKLPNRYVLNL